LRAAVFAVGVAGWIYLVHVCTVRSSLTLALVLTPVALASVALFAAACARGPNLTRHPNYSDFGFVRILAGGSCVAVLRLSLGYPGGKLALAWLVLLPAAIAATVTGFRVLQLAFTRPELESQATPLGACIFGRAEEAFFWGFVTPALAVVRTPTELLAFSCRLRGARLIGRFAVDTPACFVPRGKRFTMMTRVGDADAHLWLGAVPTWEWELFAPGIAPNPELRSELST
jgi:hypothetical protein